MVSSSRIMIIIGTKAELIKCMPLMLELQKQKKEYWFVHTGQHPLGKACDEFKVKKPDFTLSPEPKISTKFWSKINQNSLIWFISMIAKIKKIVNQIKPKYVIFHGDTMSTAAASVGSSSFLNPKKTWKNVHLEAGLRSGSLFEPFPEEISRQITTDFSDILLAVSKLTEKNLEKHNKKKKIVKVGNTIIDSTEIVYKKGKKKYKQQKKKYALLNIHRHENLRHKERLKKIVRIVEKVGIKSIWPMHDNTAYYLQKYGLMPQISKIKNLEIIPLTNYSHFIFLMSNCAYLVTDGGSIQEESLVFKKPCILLRKKTERIEGLRTGINFLTGLNVTKTIKIINYVENGNLKINNFENPYGKKGVSKKILEILK